MHFSKLSMFMAVTAGSVLTVTVIQGTAEVRSATPTESITLRAGDSVDVPAGGPVRVAATPVGAGARELPPTVIAREQPPAQVPPSAAGPVYDCQPPEGGMPEECDPSDCDECAGKPVFDEAAPEGRMAVDIEGAPSMGKSDAKVVIVEFGDFQCPYCERAMSTVHELAAQYPDDVRIVFKNFPLPGHKYAVLAAEAALAAGAQGKYWAMHDILYANRERLDRASLESYAAQLGLDMTRFKKALDEHTFLPQVERDAADAKAAGVKGIPSFLINGRVVVGSQPYENFKKIVDEELTAAN